MSDQTQVSRREFLKTSTHAAGALILGFYLHHRHGESFLHARPTVFKPNAWVRITPDNQITVLVEIPEMGQGSRTVDAMMLADELEAEWSTIRVEQAPTIPEIYRNLGTGGSGGVKACWEPMRRVGAQAREMLVTAAAHQWKVDKKDCRAFRGTVIHTPTSRSFTYGELVKTASELPEIKSESIPLKKPGDFHFIGKPVPRVDVPSKVDGSTGFGIDVRVPGMLFAVIARCPYFGGKLASFDATAAKAVPGVSAAFPVPPLSRSPQARIPNTAGGVAVVADSSWAAIQGRKALKVTWDKGFTPGESTQSLRKLLQEAAVAPPAFVPVNQGNALSVLANAAKKIEAFYESPFQAHATMEPMNTTVHVREDGIEVWSPTQFADAIQDEIAQFSGLAATKVVVHMTLSGGSFGRRAQWDYAAEAWQVAKEIKRPVQILWTREDDVERDFYRQYAYQHLCGAFDAHSSLVAWSHRIASTSIHSFFSPPEGLKDPKDVATLELGGATILPYSVPNFRVEYIPVNSAVRRAWWRSVTNFTAFAMESFMDELAHAANRDPYEFRMDLLREDRRLSFGTDPDARPLDTGRFRSVLHLAAEKSGWGKPLPVGRGRGIACHYSFDSYMAHVAEVSVERDGTVHVHRIVSAVDCGIAVNPDGVRAMTEGAINFALTEVLTGEITIKDGAVEQSNFHDYQVLRINQAPDIEVHIVPSAEDPGGMGETGVPPVAAAVVNAVFAATGVRVQRLPIDPQLLKRSQS